MKEFHKNIIRQIKDKVVDIAALVVAVSAVVVTIIQGNTQLELQKVGWQPYLVIEFLKSDAQTEKGFLLRNAGNGPAVIESFRYFKNETSFKKKESHQEWIDSKGFSKAVLLGVTFEDINYLTEGYVIPNKSENDLFLLGTKSDSFYGSPTAKSMDSVIIEIKYKSLYKTDNEIYYLKYCEKFKNNNVTKEGVKNEYEQTF